MDVMEALLARKSTPPRLMSSDGPSADEVRQFLTAAVTAPDHGSVRPWRFVVIEGDNRTKLGQVFADALKARDTDEVTGLRRLHLEAADAMKEVDRDQLALLHGGGCHRP